MDTDPRLLHYIGSPPWPDVAGQNSCKYAAPTVALDIARPWVAALIANMLATLPDANLVDIRWWAHLDIGDVPGIAAWHYDCFNHVDAPESADEDHRLYFYGAACRTMFASGFQPPEGWILGYDHNARHRITPALQPGPRLLVRVTRANIRPANRIGPPLLFRSTLTQYRK